MEVHAMKEATGWFPSSQLSKQTRQQIFKPILSGRLLNSSIVAPENAFN
jgi:hypothetical protein